MNYNISEGLKEAVRTKNMSAVRSRFFTLTARKPSGNEIKENVEYCLNSLTEDEFYMPDSGEIFKTTPTEWTIDYWNELGSEMRRKFSKRRINHMIEVANYLFPEPKQSYEKSEKKGRAYIPGSSRKKSEENTGIIVAIIAAIIIAIIILFSTKK